MYATNSSGRQASLTRRILVLIASSVLLGSSPIVLPMAAQAQSRFDLELSRGTPIRTASTEDKTLYLNNNRSYDYNLRVRQAIRIGSTFGGTSIPAGSTIRGRFEPARGGLRYVAREVEINGRSYRLDATSDVIADVKDPRDTSAGAIAGDAAIGAAGGAAIGAIFGNRPSLGSILGGAAAGVVTGNVTAERIVVIRPETTITLYSR
ncbi:hypothetical protein [Leptolyngbya sp. FACHB-261]|uniref:hypothetical protein n=1 Tax=Leptolyngbya sp. FACHB-261 TaxID=2692806 RepID=UPI0016854FDD|nr:hypothetical protein [Leptolyngbya sp. FACHB-261]MBD2103904.1 hypothetical protein [Leptolyngbya sp. FACHB-261]